jgi:hypothetical protein
MVVVVLRFCRCDLEQTSKYPCAAQENKKKNIDKTNFSYSERSRLGGPTMCMLDGG